MGLLDGGLQAVFGAAFGGLYLDATLHRTGLTFASDGDVASPGDTDEAVKAHFDRITEAMRQAEGYSEQDVAILILQDGVSVAPTTDDEITLDGQRWQIGGVPDEDPARTYWLVRAVRIGTPVIEADNAVWANGDNWVWANGDNVTWS